MVTVIGYKVATNKNGDQYFALKIIGPIEMVQSATTGKIIATVRKTVIPATFKEDVAKLMIGSQLEGTIVRVPCDPLSTLIEPLVMSMNSPTIVLVCHYINCLAKRNLGGVKIYMRNKYV